MVKALGLVVVVILLNKSANGEDSPKHKKNESSVIVDLSDYYQPDSGINFDSLAYLFAPVPFRHPANAFKYALRRGPGGSHKGYDYSAPCGTKVPSKSAGKVTKVGWGKGFGKTVAVRTGKCTHIYAHLSKYSVKKGQKVKRGTILGLSGNTGRVRGPTGCHLHYETCSRLYKSALKLEDRKEQKSEGSNISI